MVDALASGASARKGVGVQVPPRAHIEKIPGLRIGDFLCPDSTLVEARFPGELTAMWL